MLRLENSRERGLDTRIFYAGDSLLAVQQSGVNWVHEDAVTKSKRITDANGQVVSNGIVELDPWGANTARSSSSAFQPQNFTSYIRDANGDQDAMARRYSVGGRFSQPDPYGGSYDSTDPQSFNRYAYTKNDPVNFKDPSGLFTNPYAIDVIRTDTWAPFWPLGAFGGVGGGGGDNDMFLIEQGAGEETGGTGGGGGSQDTGFLIGKFKFNAEENARLASAYDRIIGDDCRHFFDKTLADMRRNGEIHSGRTFLPTTLANALAITTLNKYSSTLTAKDVGTSKASWADAQSKVAHPPGGGYFSVTNGVIISDGRVFLTDHAFYQANSITQFYSQDTDLPGVIIHELFHRAGLNETQVTALTRDIQIHCGRPGDAL